ncbi:type II secretion system protein GspL [Trinickia caryophylli]|uniref:General secretion pathway protein L n=1 Tax=Trinickia caryophylli TaxID=28094 RepID=A0A1X7H670_TRICW|nr:type II secretion system protein GspL [Trinickia caryophylli]PMS09626.1 hypothetical protein C0Z17_24345 [Trinickia caryophylli]TRX17238.1 hypothetical protein FNF07_02640 [Trinickia caryophylli]WQE12028.1 type II secretion system protein GspL [Trinickia caryophylli]SMF79800.1 general secretion pathway protein L [Trinickia caryophylli]GLU35578.1 hypothetical protein Busp01_54200 [Trinickia caryophylli]
MSTLIVLLAPLELELEQRRERATSLHYVVLDARGATVDSGIATPHAMPQARATVLVLAASDTLLLSVTLPPVKGTQLQKLLPNVVEEHVLDDMRHCHVALDPLAGEGGERYVAVVDRERLAAAIAPFASVGRGRLRVVPLVRCLPQAPNLAAVARSRCGDGSGFDRFAENGDAGSVVLRPAPGDRSGDDGDGEAAADVATEPATEPRRAVALVVTSRCHADSEHGTAVELAVRKGALGFGMSIADDTLAPTLAMLREQQPLTVYRLEPGVAAPTGCEIRDVDMTDADHTITFENLAREAMACRFDLSDASLRRGPHAGAIRPWRSALALMTLALVVSLIAVNVRWTQYRHRREAIEAQMTQIVTAALPDTTVILDAPAQMTAGLARVRRRSGELADDDFVSLAGRLGRSLTPAMSASMASLSYRGGMLELTFKPGASIDKDAFKHALVRNGLSEKEDDGKWTLALQVPARR